LLALALAQIAPFLHGQERCAIVLREKKLPVKFKSRGSPQRARWEQVDEVLTSLSEDLRGISCELKFEEIFRTDKEELYIPLTNNLVRVVPETILDGLPVFNQSEERLGEYDSRVSYQRSGGLYAADSYTLYYFQYKDPEGDVESSGNHLLLDEYLVLWSDLSERVAMNTSSGNSNSP
jgi:hypothetical protein